MKKQDVELLGHAMGLSSISRTPPSRHSNTPRSRGRGRARARTRQNSSRESSAATCSREPVALTPPPDKRGNKSEDLVKQATAEVTGNPSQPPKTENYGSPTASTSLGDKEKESGTTTSGGQDVKPAQPHSETAKETASEEAGCAKRVRIARTDQGGGPPSSVPSSLRNERKDANFVEMKMSKSPPALLQENPATSSSVSPSGESEKMADEDSTPHSQSSRSSTPNVSNPGTPRQELAPEVRATPPLAVPSTSSTIQRTIPGQPQPPSAAAIAAAASAAATAAAMAIPPQQQGAHVIPPQSQSKYSSLLAVIEDMGRDIRPTYAGNRTSSERLKRSIVHARILVRECLMECERSART